MLELDPGEGSAEYHYEYGREEWVLVLAGTLTLRHPDGEDVLQADDLGPETLPCVTCSSHQFVAGTGGLLARTG